MRTGGLAAQQPRRAIGAPHSLIGTLHSCPIKPQAGDRARQGLAPGQGGVTRWDQPCNTGRWPVRGRGRLGVGLATAPGHQTCCVTLGPPPTLSGPGFPLQVTAPLPWLPPGAPPPHSPDTSLVGKGLNSCSNVQRLSSKPPMHKEGDSKQPQWAFGDRCRHTVGPQEEFAQWARAGPWA